jgi:large subunit ribosomal protein L38
MLAWRKEQRSNKELEKAARQNTLDVNMADVKQEHEATGGLYEEIYNSAEFYGIFEDLFDGAYFKPVLNLSVEYDYDEDTVTPVYRYVSIATLSSSTSARYKQESKQT